MATKRVTDFFPLTTQSAHHYQLKAEAVIRKDVRVSLKDHGTDPIMFSLPV